MELDRDKQLKEATSEKSPEIDARTQANDATTDWSLGDVIGLSVLAIVLLAIPFVCVYFREYDAAFGFAWAYGTVLAPAMAGLPTVWLNEPKKRRNRAFSAPTAIMLSLVLGPVGWTYFGWRYLITALGFAFPLLTVFRLAVHFGNFDWSISFLIWFNYAVAPAFALWARHIAVEPIESGGDSIQSAESAMRFAIRCLPTALFSLIVLTCGFQSVNAALSGKAWIGWAIAGVVGGACALPVTRIFYRLIGFEVSVR